MKVILLAFLLSGSALSAELSCSAELDGKEILRGTVAVVDETAELSLGTYQDVELIGRAIMGQVSALMIFDGVMFGSISMYAASYKMYMIGTGELSLFCRLDDSSRP